MNVVANLSVKVPRARMKVATITMCIAAHILPHRLADRVFDALVDWIGKGLTVKSNTK